MNRVDVATGAIDSRRLRNCSELNLDSSILLAPGTKSNKRSKSLPKLLAAREKCIWVVFSFEAMACVVPRLEAKLEMAC